MYIFEWNVLNSNLHKHFVFMIDAKYLKPDSITYNSVLIELMTDL